MLPQWEYQSYKLLYNIFEHIKLHIVVKYINSIHRDCVHYSIVCNVLNLEAFLICFKNYDCSKLIDQIGTMAKQFENGRSEIFFTSIK